MAISRINQFGIFVAVLTISLSISPSDCNTYNHKVYYPKSSAAAAALFVFGDSLFDPGNNNYINTTITDLQANFSPYGQSFFKYPSGRFSNGRLIPDFIAEYAKLQLIPPFLQTSNRQLAYYGMNFASGGAGALAETFKGLVIDLRTQLNYFKNTVSKELKLKLGKKEAKILLSNAVYLFSIGNNDYTFPFYTNSTVIQFYGPENYVQQVVGNFTSVIKQIYKLGGRKFGFLNLGSLGCLPSFRVTTSNGECVEPVTSLAKLHNLKFYEEIKKMEEELKGFRTYSIFDFASVTDEIVRFGSKYGFKEVKSACCGSGAYRGINSCGGKRGEMKEFEVCENVDEYVFFDANHPTEAAYRKLAKIMWNGNKNVTGPYNLKSLFEYKFMA